MGDYFENDTAYPLHRFSLPFSFFLGNLSKPWPLSLQSRDGSTVAVLVIEEKISEKLSSQREQYFWAGGAVIVAVSMNE